MVWRRIFHRDHEAEEHKQDTPPQADNSASHSAQPSANPPAGEQTPARRLPPHMQRAIGQRQRTGADDPKARLATLRRRRTAARYDMEQGELAQQDDNPWKQRASLLTEALETVQSDREETINSEPGPYHPVAPTPIRDPNVSFQNDVATVTLSVGNQDFMYEEPLDWAERGHQIMRSDLVRTSGALDPLLPNDVPPDLREPLRAHLDLSLFVLATDLRDRTLNDDALPDGLTLADLARPCPQCGGWTDVLGRCQNCARRNARIQELDQERNRLLSERAEELEEEHRMAERAPIARRRLADIDTEIAALERSTP